MPSSNGFTVWLTGMSGAGKTTLGNYIAARLRQVGRNVEVLDERELAEVIRPEAEDTKEERIRMVKRMGFLANMLTRNGVATLVASVSPYKAGREENRRGIGRYVEVYVDCPTEKLIERDSTGKYKKALSGEIPNFIGITEPYEPPGAPEVTIASHLESVEEGARKIFQSLLDLTYVSAEEVKVMTGKRLKANRVDKKAGRSARAAKPKAAKGGSKEARPAVRSTRSLKSAKKAGIRRKAR